MKTIVIDKEYITGETRRYPVGYDGSVSGESYEVDAEGQPTHIVVGYSVSVYDDNNLEDVAFYPVQVDFTRVEVEDTGPTYWYNGKEVLGQIAADYPADKYQNNAW